MLLKLLVSAQIFAIYDCICESGDLILQPCRKHCQSHDFDQTDIFLFNMMQLRMRVIHT